MEFRTGKAIAPVLAIGVSTVLVASLAMGADAAPAKKPAAKAAAAAPSAAPAGKLVKVTVHPAKVTLSGGGNTQRFLVFGHYADGRVRDLTSVAKVAKAGTAGIKIEGKEVVLGGMTPHADVGASADVKRVLPALAELANGIGDPAVRHRGTVGGSIANADPAACYPSAVVGLDATVETNKRKIPGDEFFVGLFTTALEPGEIVTGVRFKVGKQLDQKLNR